MNEAIHSTEVLLAQVSWLRALALELVQDGGEAEDLAQEAILRALENPPRAAGAMRGFLRRVSRNILRDRARGESRRRDRERLAAREEAVAATDDLVERLAAHRHLVEAVERLDEPYRTTLLMRYFDGLPPRAIAARLHTPVKTVNTRLQRGLERLRADLDRGAQGERGRWALLILPLVRGEESGGPMHALRSARSILAPLTVVVAIAILALVWRMSLAQQPGRSSATAPNAAATSRSDVAHLDSARESTAREPISSADSNASARKLIGRVVTSDGRPIADVHVVAFSRPAASFEVRDGDFARAAIRIAEVSAAADGRFEIDVSRDAPHRLIARAPGFGAEMRDDVLAGDDVVIELARAGRFEFTVVARDGEAPCAGARLALSRTGVPGQILEGETGVDGRRTIGDLAPGIYLIEATPRDAENAFAIDLVLREGESVAHVLRASPGGIVEGRVRSAADGRPVAGARVHIAAHREVTTDASGQFTLAGLSWSQAQVHLAVEAAGFAPLSFARDPRAPVTERVELELEPEARVRGRLVDARGAPAAAAWIIVDGRETRSEADGSFVVRGLTPRKVPLLFARAEESAALATLLPGEIAAGDNDIGVVRLARAASVSGRVHMRDGRPLANAWVTLVAQSPMAQIGAETHPSDSGSGDTDDDAGATVIVAIRSPSSARQETPPPARRPTVDAGPFRNRRVRTSSAGRFEILDLDAGRYQVKARAPGNAVSASLDLELSLGEDRGDIDLAIADGLSIEGRVRGTDGEPIGGAWIVLIESSGARGGVSALSALDGSFALQGVTAGSYDLEVSFHGLVAGREYATNTVRGLVPPVSELDVRLASIAFIEGVLVDDAEQPIADWYVGSTDAQGRRISGETDDRGHFRIGTVEGATVVLAVQGPVIRGAQDADRSKNAPHWKGELAGVAAGTEGIVLHAVREK